MFRQKPNLLITHVRKKLLPAPSPVVQWLEEVLLLLPNQFQPIILILKNEVKVINVDNGDYYATGDHPSFELIAELEPQHAGWFYLEAALVRHGGNRIAKLYVDQGNGYCEDDSIFIPSNLRGSISEVIYLPYGLKNVRWSPMATTGRFTQSALIFHRITKLESFFRRAWRVWSDIWRLRKLSLAERQGVSWYSPFVNLKHAYDWCANLRRAQSATMDYPSFIKRNDTLSAKDNTAIEGHIQQLNHTPLLSIILIVDHPSPDFLTSALDSIQAQLYPY